MRNIIILALCFINITWYPVTSSNAVFASSNDNNKPHVVIDLYPTTIFTGGDHAGGVAAPLDHDAITIMRTAKGMPFACVKSKTVSSLHKQLNGQCIRSSLDPSQYWNQYEICFFQNVTLLHVEEQQAKDLIIPTTLLGRYVRGETMQEFEHDEGEGKKRHVTVSITCVLDAEKPQVVAIKEIEENKQYMMETKYVGVCGMMADDTAAGESSLVPSLEKLSNLCAQRTLGWWTYEVCPFKNVRQFHGSPPDPDNVLGVFNADATAHAKPRKLQAVQVFTDGSSCGTRTRSTRATFKCVPDSESLAIESVDESPLCNYNIRLTSSILCSVPGFQKSEPQRIQIKCEQLLLAAGVEV